MKHISIRQADVTDHMNEHLEKWLSLDITEWNEDPDAAHYLNERKFIEKRMANGNAYPLFETMN